MTAPKAPYKNSFHAVADGLVVLIVGAAGMWPAVRSGLRRPRKPLEPDTPETPAVNPHGPDSARAHNHPIPVADTAPGHLVPKLPAAEAKPGYCWICGPHCTCGLGGAA